MHTTSEGRAAVRAEADNEDMFRTHPTDEWGWQHTWPGGGREDVPEIGAGRCVCSLVFTTSKGVTVKCEEVRVGHEKHQLMNIVKFSRTNKRTGERGCD